ncbi:hypothetical protein CDAR_512661 [Caerostris darwini]|uniref:Uncharacterized protein n=1 Tax=Caerostris darwini TaxID=1538125 RepID=A0AAV4SB46_9ARAC|nr:hypothetical protein CDAR_512661 [Caerostris darwini]
MPLSQIYSSTVGVLSAYLSGNQYAKYWAPYSQERYKIRTIRVLTALAITPQIIPIIVCGIIMHKRAVASVWNGIMPNAFGNEVFALPSVHDRVCRRICKRDWNDRYAFV